MNQRNKFSGWLVDGIAVAAMAANLYIAIVIIHALAESESRKATVASQSR